MIAKETYKVIRSIVGPWFRRNGFKLGKSSYLTYQKAIGDKLFLVRFQCHHHGWEKHKGSSFTVWLQFSPEQDLAHMMANRLTSYLALPELEYMRARQNRVLGAIPPPPPEYINEMVVGFKKVFRYHAQQYIDIYLSDWKLVDKPYAATSDIWFRYLTEDDVHSWAILMYKHVENLYLQFAGDSAEQ